MLGVVVKVEHPAYILLVIFWRVVSSLLFENRGSEKYFEFSLLYLLGFAYFLFS